MTAKQLIDRLETIIDERDGEDIDVVVDEHFHRYHPVTQVLVSQGHDDQSDYVLLLVPSSEYGVKCYDAGLRYNADIAKLN